MNFIIISVESLVKMLADKIVDTIEEAERDQTEEQHSTKATGGFPAGIKILLSGTSEYPSVSCNPLVHVVLMAKSNMLLLMEPHFLAYRMCACLAYTVL